MSEGDPTHSVGQGRAALQRRETGEAVAAPEAAARLAPGEAETPGSLLRSLGERMPWEGALEEVVRMDAATFEREWQEHLRR